MKGPSALPASGQLVSLNVQQVDEEVWRPRREHYLIQASIITCQFITTLDLTILSAALGVHRSQHLPIQQELIMFTVDLV